MRTVEIPFVDGPPPDGCEICLTDDPAMLWQECRSCKRTVCSSCMAGPLYCSTCIRKFTNCEDCGGAISTYPIATCGHCRQVKCRQCMDPFPVQALIYSCHDCRAVDAGAKPDATQLSGARRTVEERTDEIMNVLIAAAPELPDAAKVEVHTALEYELGRVEAHYQASRREAGELMAALQKVSTAHGKLLRGSE